MIHLEYFTAADSQQLMGWITDEKLLMNWTGSMFRFPLKQEDMDWYIKDTNHPGSSTALLYKAVDSDNGEIVGHISLGKISNKNSSARISRVLVGNTAARNQGIGEQMIRAILKIGFEDLKLHRISLGVYSFNESAIRCYQKCGFVTEGVSRDILKYDNEYWSLVEMSMLDTEWQTQTGYQSKTEQRLFA